MPPLPPPASPHSLTKEMWHAICYVMYVYGWNRANSLLQYSYSRQRATEVIFLWLKNVGFHFVCGCESGCYFKRKFSTAADMNLCECERRIGAYGTQISQKCLQRWRENFLAETERIAGAYLCGSCGAACSNDDESWVPTFHPCHNNYTLFFFGFFHSFLFFSFFSTCLTENCYVICFILNMPNSNGSTRTQSQHGRRRTKQHKKNKMNISPNFQSTFFPLFVRLFVPILLSCAPLL